MIAQKAAIKIGGKNHYLNVFILLFFLILPIQIFLSSQAVKAKNFEIRNDVEVKSIIEESNGKIPKLMKKDCLPGLSIALVDKYGVVWSEVYGFTDRKKKKPVTPDTIFSVQSMSKTFTATGVMVAVQDGLVDLDAPITTYIPDFRVNSRFEMNPQEKMTLRHLLGHRAGFTHEAPLGNNNYPDFPSFEAHIDSISDTWLRYPVGQRYCYSNLGIDLAGYILQIVSGKPFAQYIKEAVLEPIGMKNSSFDWKTIRNKENRAIGHAKGFSKVPLEFGMIPAGALYSSVEDMAKFIQFHLNDGVVGNKKILEKKYLKEMYSVPFPVKGQIEGYALGIAKAKKYGSYYLVHGGGGMGFTSNMRWCPGFGIGMVLLTNSQNHQLLGLSYMIIDEIVKTKIGDTQPESKFKNLKAAEIDKLKTKKIIGNYVGRWGRFDIVFKDENYWVKVRRKGLTPINFTSDTEAVINEKDGSTTFIRFVFDVNNTPSHILKVNNGVTFDYNDGPHDKRGPNKKEWKNYMGQYSLVSWGQKVEVLKVSKKNGYLYLDRLRLEEYQPGLFFSSTGEALDLRKKVPTWRNIRLRKRIDDSVYKGP
ncbi:MAG: beta-lactamase family protein [bacterium]|nr:MAG: beta-lactamase family protein [bacterium]